MGRKKIDITENTEANLKFNSEVFNIMEKAYELSTSYECHVGVIIFDKDDKLYEYADKNINDVLLKYTEVNVPHKSLTNTNIIQILKRRDPEFNGVIIPKKVNRQPKLNKIPARIQHDKGVTKLTNNKDNTNKKKSIPTSLPSSTLKKKPSSYVPKPAITNDDNKVSKDDYYFEDIDDNLFEGITNEIVSEPQIQPFTEIKQEKEEGNISPIYYLAYVEDDTEFNNLPITPINSNSERSEECIVLADDTQCNNLPIIPNNSNLIYEEKKTQNEQLKAVRSHPYTRIKRS